MRIITPLWWIGYLLVAELITRSVHAVRIEGDLSSGGASSIVVGKHASYWDIPLLALVAVRLHRSKPYFEMGSFYGYPILGRVGWWLRAVGGFPVMRGKDLLRLKHRTGKSRGELTEVMAEVNRRAAEVRARILREGGVFCFFPEGARHRDQVSRLRSRHELEEALELVEHEGLVITIVPVLPCYGKKPSFPVPFLRRRPVTMRVLPAITVDGQRVETLLERLEGLMEAHWEPAPS